ncbi:hypothetical protein IFM61606_05641 [Aspergillus udagawae]|uniref:Uncharacterized protein n=1 Tax=Aspergillus udagawae TaxID=91492 RepID=A0A8H3S561_9EURO|nr:hypothetical protein IFM46972_05910 [Aspergillus udagawae]GFF44868.1 hypothetical protein IFM51744_05926 [Aspergillus udagawae]GFF83952.1 hypothetical protein IFM53868_03975 [Aspergillus udagawae]GFG12981.1 hypothetical protein IFM5058_06222 [Aspergillus udagawae]GFG25689.1 hypothetical protein IFM61606_05641 [Aspergillus udagawae]
MIARKNAISLLRSGAPRLGFVSACGFSTSRTLRNAGTALPARKPVGAFRGGLFGFLAGTVVAGASVYYYILGEYRVANQMLNEDINALQAATIRLQTYVTELETKIDPLQKEE